MAEGPTTLPGAPDHRGFWSDLSQLFRTFQVALDPRKVAVAAAGVLATALGWFLLSYVFYGMVGAKPERADDTRYGNSVVRKQLPDKKADGKDYSEEDLRAEGDRVFLKDFNQWKVAHDLAGPNGRLRTLPWYEYRGPNPFLLFTSLVGGTAVDLETGFRQFLSGTVPVLIEPLVKLLLPVVGLVSPDATFGTRIYLLLCLAWSVAVWAFFGGVITRIAVVQFAGKERVTLPEAVKFVASRYTSYALSPLVPLGVILAIVVAMALYGLLALIPILGDLLLYGLGMPLVLFGGVAIAILLIGLVGYPLMYTTLSAEGSDTFDALSRAYNYVFQAPWAYLGYGIAAILYGSLVTFFVVFLGSLSVYMGKWAVSQAPFSEQSNRRPDFLFLYAPETFGWKEVLLKGSPIEVKPSVVVDPDTGRQRVDYVPANPDTFARYKNDYTWWNYAGAGMTTFWMVLVLLLVIGFSYSYFWSASTLIYLLMRRKVDETEVDEIYTEDEFADNPLPMPGTTTVSGPAAPGVSKLPTIEHTPASAPSPAPAPLPPVAPPPVSVSPPPAPVQMDKPAEPAPKKPSDEAK
ncbi:MAG: hypothetical protein U0871_08665 [Gemmataceae bacterium]